MGEAVDISLNGYTFFSAFANFYANWQKLAKEASARASNGVIKTKMESAKHLKTRI